ncbi:cytochrome P450 [Phenylobacterium sp.]|uniref:cytochrome P450 n=1 Tax=Phenylobacterium sp. TaxID=1871053 RepID=UPI00301BB856
MTTETLPKPLTLKHPDVLQCPYAAYEFLREEAPVYFDPVAGFYVISRYEDSRRLLSDRTALNSEHATEKLRGAADPERAKRIQQLFIDKGWPRARPVGNYEGEEYRERRDLFEQFLRAGKVREYDDMVRDIAYGLAERIAPNGGAEVVSEYCEQISLKVICGLLGAPDDALPIVKESMDAMMANLGHIGTEDEEVQGALKEIAAQHYFKKMIDEKRARPDDTILSAFVNAKFDSGRVMTDPEILMHVMLDLFMAGAETSAKALTSGIYYLSQDPALQKKLQSDLDGHLRTFSEEILRLEGPAAGLYRIALRDIELHGATIPKGSVVALRVAAANRDHRHFACPAEIDLERRNAATHLSFGSGAHSCVGAPLARRELYWGFKALLEKVEDIRLAEGEAVSWIPNLLFRGIPSLNVTFRAR